MRHEEYFQLLFLVPMFRLPMALVICTHCDDQSSLALIHRSSLLFVCTDLVFIARLFSQPAWYSSTLGFLICVYFYGTAQKDLPTAPACLQLQYNLDLCPATLQSLFSACLEPQSSPMRNGAKFTDNHPTRSLLSSQAVPSRHQPTRSLCVLTGATDGSQ